MKPRFFAALLAALMIFPLTGCEKSLLDKDDPVTLTFWHVPQGVVKDGVDAILKVADHIKNQVTAAPKHVDMSQFQQPGMMSQ